MPGGASNVTLRLPSSSVAGNLGWGSEVRKSRNDGWASSVYSSFSRDVSHVTTRCRFCRHSHSPLRAHALSSRRASSDWPCPIASWWYLPAPTVRAANSSSSCDGSAPGVVMSSIGIFAVSSSEWMRCRLSGGGEIALRPSARHTKPCIADSRRSGRSAWVSSTCVKALSRPCACSGNSCSHCDDRIHVLHAAALPRSRFCAIVGIAFVSFAQAAACSSPTHAGRCAPPPSATSDPVNSAHASSGISSCASSLAKCMANVRRSFLYSERLT
mmetsp:Transcript_18340/g.62384  ORF Transcript_18340/g.62384 Transcript_18340/m.62384 type:complete len:271 (+) Transcript_18340:1005-1817(+)